MMPKPAKNENFRSAKSPLDPISGFGMSGRCPLIKVFCSIALDRGCGHWLFPTFRSCTSFMAEPKYYRDCLIPLWLLPLAYVSSFQNDLSCLATSEA
jgi:hypothetical protein